MKYRDFIEQIKILHQEANSLFDKEEIHRDPAFRKWRHKLVAALDAIEAENYDVKCNVKHRLFTVTGYTTQAACLSRYNQDLQDTINELETIIEYYENYGEPKTTTVADIPVQSAKELKYPQKVTLSWLARHAPIGLWLKFIGALVAAFLLGLAFSQTVAYRYIQQLWQKSTPIDVRTKPANVAIYPSQNGDTAARQR